MADATAFQSLQDYIAREIPISRAMGIRIARLDADGVTLHAPLALNTNDKRTAFAGSLVTLATLSGWVLTHWLLLDMDSRCDVVVARGEIDYLKPLRQDLEALCPMPEPSEVRGFKDRLRGRGRARWTLQARIQADDERAASYAGTYVARLIGD